MNTVGWIIVAIIGLSLFILVILGILMIKNKSSPVITSDEYCGQEENLDLITIPENAISNCLVDGQDNGYFYLEQQDITVAPFISSYVEVCSSYCTSVSNGTCTGDVKSYDACLNSLNQLTPVNDCIPPMPIASMGDVIYYAFAPSNLICDKS